MKLILVLYVVAIVVNVLIGAPLAYIVAIAIGTPIYCVPGIIARKTNHQFADKIILLNIFLGWTIVGWVGALVWMYKTKKSNFDSGNTCDDLKKIEDLNRLGILSQEECAVEQEKILRRNEK